MLINVRSAEAQYTHVDNVDYTKRILFLHVLPKNKTGNIIPSLANRYHVILMNMSSRTGRGTLMGDSERTQMTNIYYGHVDGLFLNNLPIDPEQMRLRGRDYMNIYAPIYFGDFSYSIHHYDLMRQKYGALKVTESYSDDMAFYRGNNLIGTPPPLYYTDEHEVFMSGDYDNATYLDRVVTDAPKPLLTYLDPNTSIVFVEQKVDPTVTPGIVSSESVENDMMIANVYRNTLRMMHYSLLSHIHYIVDAEMGISGIQFESKHKLPGIDTTYRKDMEETIWATVYEIWDMLKEYSIAGTNLRVMVDGRDTNLHIKIIETKKSMNGDINSARERYDVHISMATEDHLQLDGH